MRATTTPLTLVSLLLNGAVEPIVVTARSTYATGCSTYAGATCGHSIEGRSPLRPNHGGMQKGRFCCSRHQEGCRDRVGLHPTDHAEHATTEGGHQAFAANRPAACGGLQGAESEVRNGPRGKITTERIANAGLCSPGLCTTDSLRSAGSCLRSSFTTQRPWFRGPYMLLAFFVQATAESGT